MNETPAPGEERAWWKEAVVYQIYPRSFNDSNGDGVGDLRGIAEKVDYLDELGVDVVWLTPIYESPQVDNGYDIADYRAIDDSYGTIEDWTALRDSLHERGVRLVMDVALNHTSDQHEWFQRSRRGEEPFDDFYHWVEGDPDERPNNWESLFGGPAWHYDDEREAWYLHLFDRRMPDLDWSNPAVREAAHDVLEWWLDRGIDGFRLDVINLLSKPAGYPEGDPTEDYAGSDHFVNGPKIHEYLQELHDVVYPDPQVLTIGETIDITPADAHRFTTEDGLDMVFPFEHMYIDAGSEGPWDIVDWDVDDLRRVTRRWQTSLDGGWIGLYLANHDQPRIVSRFGDEDYRVESATMLATYLFTLRGTPFIYQGQELGMTNPTFESLEEYRDPATILRVERALETGNVELFEGIAEAVNYWSRDNARTPMQWTDEPSAGFTTGEPWLKVNENYPTVNAERERANEDSVFAFYRRLVSLRRDHPAAVYGDYEQFAPDHPSVFAYRRSLDDPGTDTAGTDAETPRSGDETASASTETLLVVLNVSDSESTLSLTGDGGLAARDLVTDTRAANRERGVPDEEGLLLSNYNPRDEPPEELQLGPYEARIYRDDGG